MEQIDKYYALLSSNSPENNLLAFQLLKSQQKWSSEQALSWIMHFFINSIDSIQEEQFFYFGNTGLVFKASQSKIENNILLNKEALYRIVLISYAIQNNKRMLLHKIDYLENESQLLNTYQTYISTSLAQILPTFSLIVCKNFS